MAQRIALFGQAAFGRDVLLRLVESGHQVAAVYAPKEGARPDPLAEEAAARELPLLRYGAMRRKGKPIAERVAEHAALGVDLNVLAFVTMILPEEVVESPRHGSLCFHPSLLPRYRGGNALAWQILMGESESGVTVFRPDAGVDTGPVVVQKGGVAIQPHHTAASLYFEALYALGVDAVCEAVDLVDRGEAVYRPQEEAQASFQGLVDDTVARIDWSHPAEEIDRRIRGCDPQPGAWAELEGSEVRLFGSRLGPPAGDGAAPGTVLDSEDAGIRIQAKEGVVWVERVRLSGGKKLPAAEAGIHVGRRLS